MGIPVSIPDLFLNYVLIKLINNIDTHYCSPVQYIKTRYVNVQDRILG